MLSTLTMLVLTIFALPGLILLSPVGALLALKAESERRTVLKHYGVFRVKGTDVMSTMKGMWCLVYYPV
jgi:hypothetical protein